MLKARALALNDKKKPLNNQKKIKNKKQKLSKQKLSSDLFRLKPKQTSII
jgi:hypothetical protein